MLKTAKLVYVAGVVELADTRALGARAFGREGSSPFSGTKLTLPHRGSFNLVWI